MVERGGSYAQMLTFGNQFCDFGSGMAVVLFFYDAGRGKNWVASLTGGKECIYKGGRDSMRPVGYIKKLMFRRQHLFFDGGGLLLHIFNFF